MTPKRLQTRPGDLNEARSRRDVAEKYLEMADLAAGEDGVAINVAVGIAVLAGIAASRERYSGSDHGAAADLLARVDARLGKSLRELVGLKAASHYGHHILTSTDRTHALRQANTLVIEARRRTV